MNDLKRVLDAAADTRGAVIVVADGIATVHVQNDDELTPLTVEGQRVEANVTRVGLAAGDAADSLARANAGVEALVNAVKAGEKDDDAMAGLLIDVGTSVFNAVVLSLLEISGRVDAIVTVLETGVVHTRDADKV